MHRSLEVFNTTWPVKHGATTVQQSALLIPGTTAETNLGVLVVGASAAADAVGWLEKELASTTSDTLVDGTVWNTRPVTPAIPLYVRNMEYDASDTAAVASTSGTTVTITSLEDNIDTSYLFAVAGTGQYGLNFVATSASGSCVTKTATGWDSTTTVIKILRLFHQLAKLNTAATKLGTDAAAGSWTALVLQNKYRHLGSWKYLDPTVDSGKTFNASTKFFAEVAVRNALAATLD